MEICAQRSEKLGRELSIGMIKNFNPRKYAATIFFINH
jgi:hypothetical protein